MLAAPGGAAEGTGAGDPGQISLRGHQRQFENIIDALRDQAPLTVCGRDARNAVALICGIYQSARDGMPVLI
jgi:hypothetical protein